MHQEVTRLHLSDLISIKGEDFNQNSTFSEYEIKQELGRGGFGKVVLGVHKRTKQSVAIKIMSISRSGTKSIYLTYLLVSAKDVDMVFREAETLKTLSHKHIVKVLNCYNLSNAEFAFAMEYLEGGELAAYVKDKGYLSEAETRTLFKQLISAMNYCHKENLIHRDLKLENILFEDKEHKTIKVELKFSTIFLNNVKGGRFWNRRYGEHYGY